MVTTMKFCKCLGTEKLFLFSEFVIYLLQKRSWYTAMALSTTSVQKKSQF